MNTEFIQVVIKSPEPLREVLIAFLVEMGYEGFEETDVGIDAYIASAQYDEKAIENMLSVLGSPSISFEKRMLPTINWNAEWERNYPSVFIDHFCQIIPPFRSPRPNFSYTLMIEPKMSFGTGHHETTRLMIQQMQKIDLLAKNVLDMGCGTGVLSILAKKMGAKTVTGIDIDPWSYENAMENIQLNQVDHIDIVQGNTAQIPSQSFDVILANINRNVLLEDMSSYVQHLANEGTLLLSGFYEADEAQLSQKAQSLNLIVHRQLSEHRWVAVCYHKYN